ncbi:MAG: hypothetical protein ABW007_08780 [Chitinophagaceae bacterium]
MLIRIITAALLTSTLFSCRADKEEITIPPATQEMTRTVSMPLRNNIQKTAFYNENAGLASHAWIEDDRIFLNFIAEPTIDRATGEGVTFSLLSSQLAAPLKTYSYDHPSNRIEHTRYTFSDHGQSTRIRIIDTKMGSTFSGTLTITAYDKLRKLISGYYAIEVPGLIYDPTNLQAGVPGEPEDQSHLQLTGSFRNVAIGQ